MKQNISYLDEKSLTQKRKRKKEKEKANLKRGKWNFEIGTNSDRCFPDRKIRKQHIKLK